VGAPPTTTTNAPAPGSTRQAGEHLKDAARNVGDGLKS
jgi:hypothetical protein